MKHANAMTLIILVVNCLQAYFALVAIHTYFPLLGVIFSRVKGAKKPSSPPFTPPRFAVLIAAHNEAAVIANCVRAVQKQHYSRSGFDIFVVADNCTDGTASLARRAGATVYERTSHDNRTKGHALGWLWGRVRHPSYGAVVLLDADNEAEPGFLAAIASEIAQGHLVVQGLRRPKNPLASGSACLDTLTELCTHRVGSGGRKGLGLSALLMGSGVAFSAPIFDKLIANPASTLVEDCEWQARLALIEVPIQWSDKAIVLDEKTSHVGAMQIQRERWVAGRAQVAKTFLRSLLVAFVTRGNPVALDVAGYLCAPPRSVMLAGHTLLFIAAVLALPGTWPAIFWGCVLILFAIYVGTGLWLDGNPARSLRLVGHAIAQFPGFTWMMVRALFKGLLGKSSVWIPTPHGR